MNERDRAILHKMLSIRGLRNRIIHDYENIDMNMFWEVICDDLPMLERELKKLLD